MSDAGYTLSETLAAMAVVGLAMGGLSLCVQVLAPLQRATSGVVAEIQGIRAAQARMEDLLARGAPFRAYEPERFRGEPRAFRFDCGAPADCKVELIAHEAAGGLRIYRGEGEAAEFPLPRAGDAQFVYEGGRGASAVWPPAAPGRQALRSVSLLRRSAVGEGAILNARLWAEQPARCAFDPISQDCR